MTEFEHFSSIRVLVGDAEMAGMDCLAVLSAYLVVCFFAGNKITKSQAWILSILYSWFYAIPSSVNYAAIKNLVNANKKFLELYPNSFYEPVGHVEFFNILAALVLFLAWIMSIAYIVYIRKTDDKVDGSFQSV